MSTRSSTTKTINSNLPEAPDRENRIRNRAYELFLERGGIDGYDVEDWLRAEAEVTGNKAKSTAA